MLQDAYDFLNKVDPSFRRKIDIGFVSFASLLEKYKEHVAASPKESRKSSSDFLKEKDPILEMMINAVDCHESAIHAMRVYAGIF